MRRLLRSLIGAVLGFLLFSAVAFAAQQGYYRFMPAKWFLNYYYAHADNAPVGAPVPLTVCRSRRYGYVTFNATRTYFLFMNQDGSRRSPLKQEPFTVNITSGASNCSTIQLKTTQQPQQAGTYVIHTEGEFYVHGYRKTLVWETQPYVISETSQSIQKEIQQLQQQIQSLQQQLGVRTTSDLVLSTIQQSAIRSNVQDQSASTTTTTATTAPPPETNEPSPTTPPQQQPGIVGQTLAPVITALQQSLNGLKL